MAAGVLADKVYPIDIDKAFASYDNIKANVVKWWETGAVPAQLLVRPRSRNDISLEWPNGRFASRRRSRRHQLGSRYFKTRLLGCPEALPQSRQRDEVHRLQHATYPAGAVVVAYSSTASRTRKPPNTFRRSSLHNCPARRRLKSRLVPFNYDWWVDNRDTVIARWNKWILA